MQTGQLITMTELSRLLGVDKGKLNMTDYWTDEELKIDDKIWLECSQPHFGGRRWWFVCPRINQPVRTWPQYN